GATASNDGRPSWSNYGSCVDLFAPGVGITSDWNSTDSATNTISGTSMATPHVTGTAALYVALHPSALPAEVSSAIAANATPNHVSSAGSGSPNLLDYEAFIGGSSTTTTTTTTTTTSTTTTSTPGGGGSVIANGGFETGTLFGWTASG